MKDGRTTERNERTEEEEGESMAQRREEDIKVAHRRQLQNH